MNLIGEVYFIIISMIATTYSAHVADSLTKHIINLLVFLVSYITVSIVFDFLSDARQKGRY